MRSLADKSGAAGRWLGLAAALIVLALGLSSWAGARPTDRGDTPLSCDGKEMSFHRHRARVILEREYRVTYYSTHEVADRGALDAYQGHKRCILVPGERERLAERRHAAQRFQEARIAATPYPGSGVYWAIPHYVAACESGGGGTPNYTVGFAGAYGVLTATWYQWGGGQYGPTAGSSPPWAQDLIAHEVWSDVGPSGWACA